MLLECGEWQLTRRSNTCTTAHSLCECCCWNATVQTLPSTAALVSCRVLQWIRESFRSVDGGPLQRV